MKIDASRLCTAMLIPTFDTRSLENLVLEKREDSESFHKHEGDCNV